MSRRSRLYLIVLLLAAALVGGLELVPRRFRGFAARDLRTIARTADQEMRVIRDRGEGPADGDAMHLALLRADDARRERAIRAAQTWTVLAAALASLLFFVLELPRTLRARGREISGGIVEVAADQITLVDAASLPGELARLMTTRKQAVLAVCEGARPRCSYCGTSMPLPVIGRVGRRVFHLRPPPGAKDLKKVLGQGWWWRRNAPDPCPKCGGTTEAA